MSNSRRGANPLARFDDAAIDYCCRYCDAEAHVSLDAELPGMTWITVGHDDGCPIITPGIGPDGVDWTKAAEFGRMVGRVAAGTRVDVAQLIRLFKECGPGFPDVLGEHLEDMRRVWPHSDDPPGSTNSP